MNSKHITHYSLLLVVLAHAGVLASVMFSPKVIEPVIIKPPTIQGVIVTPTPIEKPPEALPLPPPPEAKPPPPIPKPPTTKPIVPLPKAPPSKHAIKQEAEPVPQEPTNKPIVKQPIVQPPPAPVTPPHADASHINNPSPIYPSMSRRLREEGTVLLEILVMANGSVGEMRLKQSCGYERLDEAAMRAVKRWQFVPAMRGGEAIDFLYELPIEFSLNK